MSYGKRCNCDKCNGNTHATHDNIRYVTGSHSYDNYSDSSDSDSSDSSDSRSETYSVAPYNPKKLPCDPYKRKRIRRCGRHKKVDISCAGPTGCPGPAGPFGDNGTPGGFGPQGPPGDGGQGSIGPQGVGGDDGDIGIPGGGAGDPGRDGPPGAQGEDGGSRGGGSPGFNGAQGDTGTDENVTLISTGQGVSIVSDGTGPNLSVKSIIGGTCMNVNATDTEVTIDHEGTPVFYEPLERCTKFDCLRFDDGFRVNSQGPPGTVHIGLGITVVDLDTPATHNNIDTINFVGFTSVTMTSPTEVEIIL